MDSSFVDCHLMHSQLLLLHRERLGEGNFEEKGSASIYFNFAQSSGELCTSKCVSTSQTQCDQIWGRFTAFVKFENIWQSFEALVSVRQNFGHSLANFYSYLKLAIFQ